MLRRRAVCCDAVLKLSNAGFDPSLIKDQFYQMTQYVIFSRRRHVVRGNIRYFLVNYQFPAMGGRTPRHARRSTGLPRLVVRGIFLGALLTALAACDEKKAPAPPPVKVGVITLSAQSVPLVTELPGRTVPFRVAEVRPQVYGIIQRRLFVEGSDVKEGQPLYQIDPAPYQASYDSAAAALEAAKLLADRYKALSAANAVSKQDYANAVAAERQDEAAVETAHINLVYTRILSPISGRIGRSLVTEGALATANQANAFATIQQLDPIYVDVTQPVAVLLQLRRELASGQLKLAAAGEAEVHLILEDGSRYEPAGKLQFSEVSVDQTTGSVTLRAIFPDPDKILLPGMFVHEELEEGVQQGAILVPQQGVTHNDRGEATALIVSDESKVQLRALKIGRAVGDKWLVTEGLKPGDRVVVEGLQFAPPGTQVSSTEIQLDTGGTGIPPTGPRPRN
jgi:membrane fusion protein, multidrug efflux system